MSVTLQITDLEDVVGMKAFPHTQIFSCFDCFLCSTCQDAVIKLVTPCTHYLMKIVHGFIAIQSGWDAGFLSEWRLSFSPFGCLPGFASSQNVLRWHSQTWTGRQTFRRRSRCCLQACRPNDDTLLRFCVAHGGMALTYLLRPWSKLLMCHSYLPSSCCRSFWTLIRLHRC